MAGIEYPQFSIAPKKTPQFVDDTTAFKIGAATRAGVGSAVDTLSAAATPTMLSGPRAAAGALADAVGPAVKDFGKGLLGMNDTPTLPTVGAKPTAPKPVTAALPAAPAPVVASGSVGGGLPAPADTPPPTVVTSPSTDVYSTQAPKGISQYLPQLMAAAASRDVPPQVITAGGSPFGRGGTWDDFLDDKRDRSVIAAENAANVNRFNAGTQRKQADIGMLNAVVEPLKADEANQTHLAAAGMTANTSRATTEATNAARMKEVEITGQYGVKRSEAVANARKYAADRAAQGKGSAVQKSITPDGKIVLTQLNDQGEPATKVIDPQTALVHQQADQQVMAAQHGDEVMIPGGKGIVRIVNGVRKVFDKKTGKDIGWTPPARFSTVGMPPAGGGSTQLEDFLLDQ